MEQKLNNFHAYFPGGFYRQENPINYAQTDPLVGKMISEVDRLISETCFDIARYSKVARINKKCFSKAVSLLNQREETGKIQHYMGRADRFAGLRDDMISPIFQQMLSLGYDERELKR